MAIQPPPDIDSGPPAIEPDLDAGARAPEGITPRRRRAMTWWRTPLRRLSPITRQWLSLLGAIAVVGVLWHLGSTANLWSEAVLPAPADVFSAGGEIIREGVYWGAFRITATEVIVSFAGALVIGLTLGTIFWKAPYLGRISEPYLVSFYAVPFIVFYPVMVVVVGLNSWPIIILATAMGVIPMALNTWIGLTNVPEVYWKLAAAIGCDRRQVMLRIALPAAAPLILTGMRIAAVYSIVGCVSMEFLLAPNGLGFQIRYLYQTYEQTAMVFYMITVFCFASVVALTIASIDWRVVGRTRR